MYTVVVTEISPGGVRTITERDYYEVSDALTVAEIELKNSLLPIGRIETTIEEERLEYRIEDKYGTMIFVKVTGTRRDGTEYNVTLRERN